MYLSFWNGIGIVWMIYKHMYKIKMFSIADTPVVPILISPSISGMGVSNPGVRLYTYNRTSGVITNYQQYSLNLALSTDEIKPDWSLFYSSSQSYNVQDVSASSLQDMVDNFTGPSNEKFQYYVDLYSSNHETRSYCAILCWRHHICSICHVDYDTFDHCLNTINAQIPDNYIYKNDITEILNLDSNYDNVFKTNDDDDGVDKIAPIPKYNRGSKHPFDWGSITDNGVDIFGNPVEDEPPCPNWNARCQPRQSVPMVPNHGTQSYMYVIVYVMVGLLVFSVVLVTILCCFWPRHQMFSNEPRYVAVKTTDAMDGFDNAGDTLGYY